MDARTRLEEMRQFLADFCSVLHLNLPAALTHDAEQVCARKSTAHIYLLRDCCCFKICLGAMVGKQAHYATGG